MSDTSSMELFANVRSVLVIALGLLVTSCSPSTQLDSVSPIDNQKVEFSVEESFAKLNATRSRFFLSNFEQDPRLMEAAKRHADLMSETGKFGHEFGPATKFQKRIFAVGFKNSAGENLGVGYRSIDAAIEGWLNSSGHRKILLKRSYTKVGIAYAPNLSGKNPRLNHFWVLIVGKE